MKRPRPLGSGADYLASTESAVRHLLDGIDEYRGMLRKGIISGPSGFLCDDDPLVQKELIDEWLRENEEKIAKGFDWQRRYSAERFAMATLCGAVLHVAQKGLEVHSTNTQVPNEWKKFFSGKLSRYCVGDLVRSIPRGMVVYAARNQHVHFNDKKLGAVNREVFDRLALAHGHDVFLGRKDPAFDLSLHAGESLAPSIIDLLGWRDYGTYDSDMRSMLLIPANN